MTLSPFKALSDRVLGLMKDSFHLRSMDRNRLHEVLKQNRAVHETAAKGLASFDNAALAKLMQQYNSQNNIDPKDTVRQIPRLLHESYLGKAKAIETSRPFGALEAANKTFVTILSDIERNLDKLFEQEEITLANTRLTGVMVLGLLRQSDMLADFTIYLWDYVLRSRLGEFRMPPYRAKFLNAKLPAVINVVNDVCGKEGNYSFLKEVEGIRRKNADTVLYAGNSSFYNFLNATAFNGSAVQSITAGLAALNFFLWIGEKWDSWQHNRYLRNKEFKQWMETHVALLRLQLLDKDPNSPEYLRLTKVIKAYDALITEYDQKLQAYLEED